MTEHVQLEQAIAALEAQRSMLGDAVVDAAIGSIQERLAALAPTPHTEQRKLVTVLFADLVGWTSMSEQMDPEDVRAVQQAYFAAVSPPITERDGRIEKYIGDAVLAVFGVPQAREDDPERAIRAALAMQQAFADLNHQLEVQGASRPSLAMRLGIHTGPVLATMGQRPDDFVVTGDTVNLASRLQAAAAPGGVLISHDTWRHVQGLFDAAPQDLLTVKGKSEPVQTYLVVQARPRRFRDEARGVAGIQTRMVGREAELLTVQNALQDTMADGELRLITVTGEAGVGKSRLLFEFERWADGLPENIWYFKGRASADTVHQPYSILRDMLAARFGVSESDTLADVRSKLEDGLFSLGEGLAAHVGQLLGYDFSDVPAVKALADDPRRLREQALSALASYFQGLAAQDPVVMLMEDLHWADDSSLDALNQLAQLLMRTRLFVLAAARPDLYQRRPHWGEGWAYHSRLNLRPLSKRAGRQLVAEILQYVDHIPESLQELLVNGADGNPFFVEELIKMLIEDGVIVTSAEPWRIDLERLSGTHLPATLTGVLQARLDRLSADERSVLQQASVVGPVFWDLAVLACSGLLDAGDEQVLRALRSTLFALRERELVYRRETSAFADAAEHTFKHAILRDVTYESILKRVRRGYHGLVADWLIVQTSERVGEFVGLIADHLDRAERGEEAADYLLRAGDQARMLYAHQEAVGYYERALALQKKLGQRQRAASIYMRIGLVYQSSFDAERSQQAFENAFALWGEHMKRAKDQGREATTSPALRVAIRLPQHLDPAFASDTYDVHVATQIFSGLVREAGDSLVVPDLAERWEVLDGGRQYVFHLRQDARWSDGAPVTAHDLEFAWRRNLDPALNLAQAYLLDDVCGARAFRQGQLADPTELGFAALDDTTFAVDLEGPTAYFLYVLATPVALPSPRHTVQIHHDRWTDPELIVGNGPFLPKDFRRGEHLTLVRNNAYPADRPGSVEQIDMVSYLDAPWHDMLDRYAANELDVLAMWRYPPEAIDAARRLWASEVIVKPESTEGLGFNTTQAPFDDSRVRRAFIMALDRRTLAEHLHPNQIASGGWVPPGLPGHSPDVALPFDPAGAQRLLADAGYPKGRGLPEILLEWPDYYQADSLCRALQDMWNAHLGITVAFELSPPFSDKPQHAPVFWCAWSADYRDPDSYLRGFFAGTQAPVTPDSYWQLVDEGARLLDHEARMVLYRRADRMLIEQAVLAPLAYTTACTLVKPWVTGYWTNGLASVGWKDIIVQPAR